MTRLTYILTVFTGYSRLINKLLTILLYCLFQTDQESRQNRELKKMAQQMNKEMTDTRLGADRSADLSLARKDFSRELSRITDPSAVLTLPRRDLYEQVDYIVSELILCRKMKFSSQDRKILANRVMDDLVRTSLKACN